jgi:MFS family permease
LSTRAARAPSRLAAVNTFRSPGYRFLWAASLLWNQARWMDQVVLGWVVLELTNSAWDVALIGVVRSLPVMLLGVLGGAVADRLDRRRLLIVTQGLGALVSLALGALLATGQFVYWHGLVGAVLLGVQWAVDWPTRRALIPDLVGRELTMNAVVLESISMNLTRVVGPLMAGWLLAYLDAATAYMVMAALYGLEIVLLALMPLRAPGRPPAGGSVLRSVREGFTEIRRSQPIVGVLLITVFMNALAFPYTFILPVFARDVLAVDPIGLGILGAASGIGSLSGALVLATRGRIARAGTLFWVGSLVMSAGVALFAVAGRFELAVGLLLLAGLGSSTFSAFQSTIILAAASDRLRGRAMGFLTLAIGTAPIGLIEIGALTATYGAPAAVAANAALCALLIVATAAALPGFRRVEG